MRLIILFFMIALFTFNANAQLGNLFKKIGETIDNASKKITENPNNETNDNINKALVDQGKPVKIEEYPQLIGRWSTSDTCAITDKKSGGYLSLSKNGELFGQNYTNTGELFLESTVNKIEKYEVDNKTYLKLTGTYKDKAGQQLDYLSVWDITSIENNKFLIYDSVWNNQYSVKEGILLQTKERLGYIQKCSFQGVINNSSINYAGNERVETEKLKESVNKTFGIKGFHLGKEIPSNIITNNKESIIYINGDEKQVKVFETTILGIPYVGHAILLNNKIVNVTFIDHIYSEEIINRNIDVQHIAFDRNAFLLSAKEKRSYQKLGPLKYDFAKVVNDTVVSINDTLEKLGKSNKPIIEKKIGDHTKNTFCAKGLNNDCNFFTKVVQELCQKCPNTVFTFKWEDSSSKVTLVSVIPESKDMPFIMNTVIIDYEDKVLAKRLSDSESKHKNHIDSVKNAQLIEAERRRKQMDEQESKRRKNDF